MKNKKFLYVSGQGELKIQDLIESGALKFGGKYYKTIVFAAETGQIWNHGLAYGMSSDAAQALVEVVGDSESGLVKDVNDIKNLIAGDSDGLINKLSEVIQFFESVSDSETGTALLSQVAKNKLEIGVKSVPAIKYTQEEINAAKEVVEREGYVVGTNPELEMIANKTTNDNKEEAVEASGIFKRLEDLENKDFSVNDESIEGQYVSKISQTREGRINIERTALPKLSVKSGSDNYVGVEDHKIEIKISKIRDVKLAKLDDGTYTISTLNSAKGIAEAQDVALELFNTAAPLIDTINNHEERISGMEDWSEYDWEEV